MTHHEAESAAPASVIDHENAFEQVRLQLAGLDAAINELRAEADRLRDSAASRDTFVALELAAAKARSTERGTAGTDTPTIDGLQAAEPEPAGGGHAETPDAVEAHTHPPSDARDLDTEEPAFGHFAEPATTGDATLQDENGDDAELELAAAPAFEDELSTDPSLGPVSDGRVERPEPVEPIASMVLGGDEAVPPAPVAVEPAGALGDVLAVRSERSDAEFTAMRAADSGPMPAGWDQPGADDAAFDRFFSDAVEPEPAQRWLLDD